MVRKRHKRRRMKQGSYSKTGNKKNYRLAREQEGSLFIKIWADPVERWLIILAILVLVIFGVAIVDTLFLYVN